MDVQPARTMRNLPDTLSSLMGFNKHLTPSWIESVSHIIDGLPRMKVVVEKTENIGDDNTESENKVEKIQDELVSLNAQLKQITLHRREALNNYLDLKGNIRVFCRIRPFHHEETYSSRNLFTLDESSIFLQVAETKRKQYKFDKVFNPLSTQGDVFSEVEPVIKSALDGYNVCIFAYGQTGSGKTYTMEGKPTNLGVIPRGIQTLFNRASECSNRFLFTFSMLEIYMGNIRDLLAPRSKSNGLKNVSSLSIKSGPDGGIEIEDLVAVTVNSFEEVKRLYEVGTRLRSTASTMANSTSSRSHCLIRISLTCLNATERRKATSKLWMIDLGGSERLVKTKATGKRLKEGKAINLSLSALGDVIDALQTKKPHVPYRNSKLTQVLRDSLGCESKTVMLVHVSPNEGDLCETICTLGFATRVRSIRLESEEPPEVKARKETLLIDLGLKVNDLEHECEEIRRKIKNLEESMEQLTGSQPTIDSNFDMSHLFMEELKTDASSNVRSSKNRREVSSRLPRFMKPTASSQHRIGLNNCIHVTNRKKPPVPPRRRPSSVYAESVTIPGNAAPWQSECSMSMTSDMNWTPSIRDGTECSQDASEYEIKQVIFSEHDKSLHDQVTCYTDYQLAESRDVKNKIEEKGIVDIENWLHQQIIEKINTCRSKLELDIPIVTEDVIYVSSIPSPITMACTKAGSQVKDKGIYLTLQPSTDYVEDMKQAKALNQFAAQEFCTPPIKEFYINNEVKGHKNENLVYHGRPRKSLQEELEDCMLEKPDKDSRSHRLQDEKHKIGKLTKFFQALRQHGLVLF
uniref:Kinesin motor domain-containing protein n=1 Tax=Oryza brachyantha TaxID=4533 RepID=J3KYG5_ORYBR